MKTKTLLLSLTTALALSAATAPAASALETEFIATGTLYGGSFDETGVFGPADSSLDGDAFTADFYIDTSKGQRFTTPGASDLVEGGYDNGTSSPISATLTIGGLTQNFNGSYSVLASVEGQSYQDLIQSYVSDTDQSQNFTGDLGVAITNSANDEPFPTTFGQAFSISTSDGSNQSDGGFFELVDPSTGIYTAYGNLNVTSIISPGAISAAPEPSTWAFMIAGVGMIGASLRLGRRRGALATA